LEPASEALVVTREQVARLLAISKRTLDRMVTQGAFLPPIKVGKSVRWRIDELKAWIAAGCPLPSSFQERNGK
jgi:excisionase family DNA binding protein